MHVRCIIRPIPRALSHTTRYRGTPTPNQSHSLDEFTFHSEGNTESDGQSSSPQPRRTPKSTDKWDDECEVALQSLTIYLTSPPLLSKSVPGEDLFVYLAVSNSAVSSALIREELEAQHPIFYTSKALLDAETRYPKLDKLIFSLVISARKLRHYYQAHRAIELSQYNVFYRPKTAIKAQALANFVAEFTPSAEEEKLVSKKKESSRANKTSAEPDQPRDMWQLRVAGALNQKGAGTGVVIVTPDGTLSEQAITVVFLASNNEAEYEALLAGLSLANELSIKKLAIYSDSQLITNQGSGEYMAKRPRMILYLDKVQEVVEGVSYLHHSAGAPSRERARRCTGKLRISAGYPVQTLHPSQAP
ncbi:hypothetical protein L3X38_025578 [Prunus dulcis]|uniref:RNase H type-1 domain-containing protein n=1 Tax=Prunus dulcis TaxID=3755 RepID=A0AAD4W1Y1_PRUDU|nr:hypothetical protein L3X38_025578 [Prunus dulcis]